MEDSEKGKEEYNLSLTEFESNLLGTVELVREGFLPGGTRFGIGELSGTPSMDMVV